MPGMNVDKKAQAKIASLIDEFIIWDATKFGTSRNLYTIFKQIWDSKEISLSSLSEKNQTSKSAITNQLKTLEIFGLLKKRWDKKERIYSINEMNFLLFLDKETTASIGKVTESLENAIHISNDFNTLFSILGVKESKEKRLVSFLQKDYLYLLLKLKSEPLSDSAKKVIEEFDSKKILT